MSQHALVHIAIPATGPAAAGTCDAALFDRMEA
jgi:hypothetical protein